MPKPAPFAPKPAIEKLPLAVRKDIRDTFEADREELETKIAEIIGTTFKVNINAGEVWAYAEESSASNAGGIFKRYTEGFIDALKSFVDKYGDDGKTFFNTVVTQSELALDVHPKGNEGPTISSEVKDGVYRILFRPNGLGYNTSSQYDLIVPALEAVPQEGFSLRAKNSIEEYWTAEEEDLKKELGALVGIPDITLDPNFEEVYAALTKAKKDDKDWHSSLGSYVHNYFKDGVIYQLGYQGFKDDDMLQEGLQEAVTSKTFKLRIVDKLQTTGDKWGYNTSEMGSGFIDLL